MILTVAIPTYNRPEKVKKMLVNLLPQVNGKAKVLIVDNCSDVNVETYIRSVLEHESLNDVTFFRNKYNIGPDANFAHCFEYSDTLYTWMLGDDDDIAPGAVQLILDEIELFKNEDLVGFNFSSNCCHAIRTGPVLVKDLTSFVNKLDDFGNLLFISTSVYKTGEYVKYLKDMISGAYSMASQLIPPLKAINKGMGFVLSEKYIVTNIPETDHSKGWSPVNLALSLSAFLEAPIGFKNDDHKILGKKMAPHFNCLYPVDALFIMIRSVNGDLDKLDDYHIYLLKQLVRKTISFRERLYSQLPQYYIALFLLKNKFALKLLFKLNPRLKDRPHKFSPFHLFQRNS